MDPTMTTDASSVKSMTDVFPNGKASPVLLSAYSRATQGLGNDGPRNSDHADDIPIIDVSLLMPGDPDVIRKLRRACEVSGFFMATNHGVSEDLMTRIQDACSDFFNMTEDEKRVYLGKDMSDC